MIEIYSDGSCDNVGRKNGSWGFVVVKNNSLIQEQSEYALKTTNNRMEYIAAIKAFSWLYRNGFKDSQITLYSDSLILVRALNSDLDKRSASKWAKTKNPDLVERLRKMKQHFPLAKYNWIKGHSGIYWNEYVDKICRETMMKGSENEAHQY